MVIDTRKNILKHNLKQMKLTDKEKKLLLFLSDNKPHTTREIRKYVGYLTDLQTRLFIRELNRRTKQELNLRVVCKRSNKFGFTGWDFFKIERVIAITY